MSTITASVGQAVESEHHAVPDSDRIATSGLSTAESTSRRRSGFSIGNVVTPLLFVLLLAAAWHLITLTGVRPTVLPSPGRVLSKGWAERELLWANTLPTIKETVAGIFVSLVAAMVIATVLDFSAFVRRAIYPVLVTSQSIPIIVIAPLMVIWFGFGMGPKILVIVMVTFFPITVSLLEGFGSADADAGRLLKSMGANRWQVFRRLRVPSALPFFFAGMRIVASYAVIAAIFSEAVGAKAGLGVYIQTQKNMSRTDLVLAAVLMTMLLSLSISGAIWLVQTFAVPWERRRKRQERQS